MSDAPTVIGLAQRIASLQKASGMSVEAFAEQHGVKRTAQFQYQSGHSTPDLNYLLRLSQSRGVTLHWLVFGDTVTDGGLSNEERQVIERWRGLPRGVRRTVDDVLLLAWLAADSRRSYEKPQSADSPYPVADPTQPLQLHEPKPRRAAAKKDV